MAIRNKVIIWDIDGTLANCNHRLPHILKTYPPDWDKFDAMIMADTPIKPMITLNRMLHVHPFTTTLILTSRDARCENKTIQWLNREGVLYDNLCMRPKDDRRPAYIVKMEYMVKLAITPWDVITFFEDDPAVIKHFRESGYHVCAVDDRQYVELLSEGGRNVS